MSRSDWSSFKIGVIGFAVFLGALFPPHSSAESKNEEIDLSPHYLSEPYPQYNPFLNPSHPKRSPHEMTPPEGVAEFQHNSGDGELRILNLDWPHDEALIKQLEQLEQFKNSNLITEEEYLLERRKLLEEHD